MATSIVRVGLRIVAVAALAVLATGATAFWAAGRFVAASDAYNSGNEIEALRLMHPLALVGLSKAQFFVGVMYDQGGGVQRDTALAAQWYRKAAEKGFAPAQFALGALYSDGRGIDQDHVQAAQWYRKAAEQGFADAENSLGDAYANGQGLARDYREAARWYRKAAEQDVADACISLGNLYAIGRGVRPDNVQAYMWFSVATLNGYARGTAERNDVASRMTPAQVAEAEALSRQWRARVEAKAAKGRAGR